MRNVPIGKVAEVNPTAPKDLAAIPNVPTTFIPMAAVSEEGQIVDSQVRPVGEVLKGYRYFEQGDVLVAKITPCMENGKAAIANNIPHKIGFGSTEFHVLRPTCGVDGRYLFYMVWNPMFRRVAERNMTGTAGQKRVPTDFVKRYQIPLPPPSEQRRIATILDKADAIRRKRQEALALTDEFLRSAFLEMFGDPVTNPKGWKKALLSSVGTLDRGVSKHRPRNAPELLGGPYPLIQTGDVANANSYIEKYTQTYSELGLKQSKMWRAGTLCITIAANIAKTAILTFDSCFPDSVVGFTPNDLAVTEYVQYWLSFLQKTLEDTAPESAQKNINLRILRELTIPLPPKAMQEEFQSIVIAAEKMKRKYQQSQDKDNELFHSLQQKAFRGELRLPY